MNPPGSPVPSLHELRRLARRRSSRTETGRFLVDGPVLVREALASGVTLDALYAQPDCDPELRQLVGGAGVQVIDVAEGSLRKVLDLVNPQPVVAVAHQRPGELDDVLRGARARSRSVLALVGIQDPGNAGTLVRVAEAAGCAGVVLTTGSVDPWNPKVVRATAGSLFRVPVVPAVTVDDLLLATSTHEMDAVGTAASGGVLPEDCSLTGARLLLVGGEAGGLDQMLLDRCSAIVSIPMEGAVESLNAAVAGALLAFEAARQVRALAEPEASGASERIATEWQGPRSAGPQ